jgi:membrane protein required for colicin V production
MNLLDFILIVIIAYCLVRGIFRGLVKELSSIIGVLGGLYAAYAYYPLVAASLSKWVKNTGYQNILSCLVLFLGVYLIVSLIGVIIKYVMNIVFLGWTDRLCGAFLGTVKGLLLAAILILVLTTFLPKNASILRDSVMTRNMMSVSATLVRAASKDMKLLFIAKMKELNKSWHNKNS